MSPYTLPSYSPSFPTVPYYSSYRKTWLFLLAVFLQCLPKGPRDTTAWLALVKYLVRVFDKDKTGP